MDLTNINIESRVPYGGITDIQGAKQVAKSIFELYDKNGSGEITSSEIFGMMKDAYKDMGKGFNPTKADTDTYFDVLDNNKDGKITLQDLEDLAIKYLVGNNHRNI
ncbi:hypothetical protein IMG5_172600 [Ichthyophthirius multifiliis]|uniref:EF-hand domain-containing protein n=1 Tax=Ichthyophthirius multifiliis TaxID=5932 RepID=G0R1T4_ICHMU|nr:hypothetical protein IMG5_172600 [Ichthyophthirius multifiliis]EGR28586.1 hypothetical protein IMG5_172600 [Ichthyophthirius multifiliis]|eukprot:XP_004029822.1 hypothetical protein IMG5_172600 [Ichthyophthirius multifiliis]